MATTRGGPLFVPTPVDVTLHRKAHALDPDDLKFLGRGGVLGFTDFPIALSS